MQSFSPRDAFARALRAGFLLAIVVVLVGCAKPADPRDAGAIALAPSDVSPQARAENETRYADSAALARDTEGWASRAELETWGFVSGLGRVIEAENGTRVSNVVYLFQTPAGAEAAFAATQGPFARDDSQWASVPARRAGDGSGLWRHDIEGSAFFVMNLRAGSVVSQVLATGPGVAEERVLAWGDLLASRASSKPS